MIQKKMNYFQNIEIAIFDYHRKLFLIKHIIYNTAASLLPKWIINILGSMKNLESLRDWLFDRNTALKPVSLITWNNLEFYFRAPLQILRKARINGIENSLTKSIL